MQFRSVLLLVMAAIAACSPAEDVAGTKASQPPLVSSNPVVATDFKVTGPMVTKTHRLPQGKVGRAVERVQARGRTRAPHVPVAITAPTACDWTSPASGWRDRSACRSTEALPGAHKVLARIEDLDTRVADEVDDAEAFDWGRRLLNRQGGVIVIGRDIYVTYKGGNYTPCSTVGPTDPCGPDLWDERIYGVRAYRWGDDRRLELQWEYASDWVPPAVNVLSQSWEPVFQPVASGSYIFVPEGRGQISKVDRATGLPVATISSPETTPLTYLTAPPTATDAGVLYFTSMTISAADPYTALSAWLVRVAVDGTQIVKNVNELVSEQPARCRLFFRTIVPRPALPYPPAPGALAPTYITGAWRFGVNASPAVSLDGLQLTVVARARQCADVTAVVQLNATTMAKHWERSVGADSGLDNGCGPQRANGAPTKYLIPNTAAATETSNNLDCRVGSTLGVDRQTGAKPGSSQIELAASGPVALPSGMVAIGMYNSYDNERGHVRIIDVFGNPYYNFNFGWNYNMVALHPVAPDPITTPALVFLDSHYDNGPYSVVSYSQFGAVFKWSTTNTHATSCARSGDIYACQPEPVPTAPGPGQVLKRVLQAGEQTQPRDVPFQGSSFVFVPRAPVVTGGRNLWVTSTDGVLRLLDGQSGKIIDTIQADSALNQSDVPLSIGPGGEVYAMQNGQLTVVGK